MNDAPAADLLAPRAALDPLSFEELSRRYCFDNVSDRRRLFVRLLLDELAARRRGDDGDDASGPSGLRVLDIGCGGGIGVRQNAIEYLKLIRHHCDELWGIEPDTTMQPAPGVIDHFQHATLETAQLPAEHFDAAYAVFVMEHVPDAHAFLAALHRVLKPGGVFMFLTPNGRHFMPMVGRTLKALHLDEAALRLVRGKRVDDYHYPVFYRFNRPRVIDAAAEATGFDKPGYIFFETGARSQYFPGPLRVIPAMMRVKRGLWRNPGCLQYLLGRIVKPR